MGSAPDPPRGNSESIVSQESKLKDIFAADAGVQPGLGTSAPGKAALCLFAAPNQHFLESPTPSGASTQGIGSHWTGSRNPGQAASILLSGGITHLSSMVDLVITFLACLPEPSTT